MHLSYLPAGTASLLRRPPSAALSRIIPFLKSCETNVKKNVSQFEGVDGERRL